MQRPLRCGELPIDQPVDWSASDRGHAGADNPRYGERTQGQAEALLRRQQRFFGIATPGTKLAGLKMHQRLLEAYDKVRRQHVAD